MTLKKKLLTDYLKPAKKITGKNALSVLNNTVITVDKDKLYLVCTNLTHYFEAEIPLTDDGFGSESFVFPSTLFQSYTIHEAVKNCKGKEIEVTLNHHGDLCFNDIVLPKSDIDFSKYPENPFSENELTSSGTIDRMDTFKRAFKFISEDETRYFMGGVHFVLTDGKLHFEATDGRTGLQSDPTMGKSEPGINVDHIVTDISNFFHLNMNHFKTTYRMIQYSNEMYKLTVCNLEGRFPNISRVIPDLNQYDEISIDRESFVESLKKLTIELKMRGRIKPDKTRVHILQGEIMTDEDTGNGTACSIPCETGFDSETNIAVALLYLNLIFSRDHDFSFWINKEDPSNRAICIVDKVFGTVEVSMPMKKD